LLLLVQTGRSGAESLDCPTNFKRQRALDPFSSDIMDTQSSSKSPIPSSHRSPCVMGSTFTCEDDMLGSEDSPIPSGYLSPNDDCVIESDVLYTCKGVFSTDDSIYSNIIDQGGEVSSKLESIGEVFHSVCCTQVCESECIRSAACGNLFKNKDRLFQIPTGDNNFCQGFSKGLIETLFDARSASEVNKKYCFHNGWRSIDCEKLGKNLKLGNNHSKERHLHCSVNNRGI